MAASIQGLEPDLREYLHKNRLPDIYEALLTGLAIMCPEDPRQYIIECLTCIKQFGYDIVSWDAFILDENKPANKNFYVESSLDALFNFDDSQPTPDMIMTAYAHYNTHMKRKSFNAWVRYHLYKRRKLLMTDRKVHRAATHIAHRSMRSALQEWAEWKQFRRGRQSMFHNIIQNIYNKSVSKVIFKAWYQVVMDTRRTREYFEAYQQGVPLLRLDRGELDGREDDDGSLGVARNEIGEMERSLAVKIFKWLDMVDLSKCSQVCRSWKEITEEPELWKNIDFAKVKKRVYDKIASRFLAKSRTYVMSVNLNDVNGITYETFKSVSECKNLLELDISNCEAVNDESIKAIAEGCKILTKLNFSFTDVSDGGLRSIANGFYNLHHLNMAYCDKVTNRGLEYLSQGYGAKHLHHLNVSGCDQFTAYGYQVLAEGCPNLTELVAEEIPDLCDQSVQALGDTCRLRELSLIGSPMISDEPLRTIASGKRLRRLKIEANSSVTDFALRSVGRWCTSLTQLHLVECPKITDQSLKAISGCRALTVLNLSECLSVTDDGLKFILDGPSGPLLRELNLSFCFKIGDFTIINLHKRCMSLTYLRLSHCTHITKVGVDLLGHVYSLVFIDLSGCQVADQGLSSLGSNPGFRTVVLSKCSGVSDLGLQKFSQQCREVTSLHLSQCSKLTDGAIKNLAFCCRLLDSLDLSGCKLLSDQSVQYLTGVCQYLRELNMSACILLTDKSMRYLRRGCRRLEKLTVLYCKKITKKAAQKVRIAISELYWSNDEIPAQLPLASQ